MGSAQGTCCCNGYDKAEETDLSGAGASQKCRPQDLRPESGRDAVLGCSSIGTVLRARNQRSQVVHALRQISKRMLDGQLCRDEVEQLRRLDHTHICKLHETWEDPMSLYMILDLCNGGNLTDLGATQEQLSEAVIAVLVEQMVSAVSHMHDQGMVHSDLRPENWLFQEPIGPTSTPRDLHLKMIDFGLASKHSKKGARHRLTDQPAAVYVAPGSPLSKAPGSPKVSGCSSQGSPSPGSLISDASSGSSRCGGLEVEPALRRLFCKAPEQICKVLEPRISGGSLQADSPAKGEMFRLALPLEKADCWALGVITYFMLSGQSPFPMVGQTPENDSGFRNARFVFMPTNLWRPISSEAKNFVALCLHKDPNLRPSATRLLRMPWMQRARGEVRHSEAIEMLGEGSRLPTSATILLSLERMRRLQLVERAATIATAFRLPADELPALRKALEQRDTSKLGFIPVQELLHILANQFDVNCTDLAILVQESSCNDSCNIPYSSFVSDVLEFQQNTQDSVVWEVFSRLGGGNPDTPLPKEMLVKALDGGGEYSQCLVDHFPQLPLQHICKELEKDAKGRLCYDEFRQVLQEAKRPKLNGTAAQR